MDGYGPAGEPVGAAKASSITLRTLTRRAQRLASDGTGVEVRFQDARDPWNKLARHVLTSVVRPDDGPIIDVRKSRNWNRNRPNALVPADPQAWYVRRVQSLQPAERRRDLLPWIDGCWKPAAVRRPPRPYARTSRAISSSRSTARLPACWTTPTCSSSPTTRASLPGSARRPHATATGPSLMQAPRPFCVSRPATAQRPGFSTTRRQRRTPIWGTTDGDTMTISHLANRISPREKCRDRGAGHSRQHRYAYHPGRAFRPAPIFVREMARFRVQKERLRREPIPVSRASIRC